MTQAREIRGGLTKVLLGSDIPKGLDYPFGWIAEHLNVFTARNSIGFVAPASFDAPPEW
jgi:hypothetical protein